MHQITDPGDFVYRGISATRAYELTAAELAEALPQDVAEDSPRPDTARPALEVMRKACELAEDLLGGSARMRARSQTYLPREAEETEANYRSRVARSTCYPLYKDTLYDLASRPFPRDLSWDQDPPAQFVEFLTDVDGTRKSLTVFAKDELLHAMHRGLTHVLVDASRESGRTAEKTDDRRVYAQRIDPLCLLDIEDQVDEAGRLRVTYLRFLHRRVVRDPTNRFKQSTEWVIYELTKGLDDKPGTSVEWHFDKTSRRWVSLPAQAYNPGRSGIPFFTLYTQQTGKYQAEPLLADLADINLAHFQSRSDHANVMRIARLVTLVTIGFDDPNNSTSPLAQKASGKITLGPLSRINSTKSPKDAFVSFLETNGKSLEFSFRDMEDLLDEAKRLGARHLTSKTGNVTARAVTLDDAKSVNNLQTFCLRLEVFLRAILDAVAEWLNLGKLPAGVQPRVHKEFATAGNIEGGARALGVMINAGVLSRHEILMESIRYGILRPDFPVDENLRAVEKEQRASLDLQIAMAAGTPGGRDPDPDDGKDPEDDD